MAIRFTRAGLILSAILVAGSAFGASREELAAALGVSYWPDGHGGLGHAAVISLLDDKGEIVFQQRGTEARSEELLAKVGGIIGAED